MSRRFLPDVNVLLYALNRGSVHHPPCRKWLEEATAAGDAILINGLTECALLRISTLPRIAFCPMPVALRFWQALVDCPSSRRAVSGPSHRLHFTGFITELGLSGNDVNDAWLAALAIEQQATLVSTDEGFARFTKLDWLNPVA